MIYDSNNIKVIHIGSSYALDRSVGKRLTDYIYKDGSRKYLLQNFHQNIKNVMLQSNI